MTGALINRLLTAGYIRSNEVGNPLVIILRIFAIPIVILCLRIKIHPNIITCLSLVLGCLGAALYFMGQAEAFILAWSVSIVLDYTDGTIARKSGKVSHFGYLFDMLGDRLKLVSLVIAWCFFEDGLLATLLATLIILILFVTEVIAHLFIQHVIEETYNNTNKKQLLYQVFMHFHMHSFFIYGVALYYGGVISMIASLWLVCIMSLDLMREVRARMFFGGVFSIKFNDNIISKLSMFRSKDE